MGFWVRVATIVATVTTVGMTAVNRSSVRVRGSFVVGGRVGAGHACVTAVAVATLEGVVTSRIGGRKMLGRAEVSSRRRRRKPGVIVVVVWYSIRLRYGCSIRVHQWRSVQR